MKRVVLITMTIGLTVLGVFLLWVFQGALELFAGSLALAAALRPLIRRMEQRGVSRVFAITIWFLIVIGFVIVGAIVYGTGLSSELGMLAEQGPRAYNALVESWRNGSEVQQALANGMPPFDELVTGNRDAGLSVLGGVFSSLSSVAVFAIGVLSLGFFWLLDATHFERLLLSLLPINTRIRARDMWRDIEEITGTYIRVTIRAVVMATLLLAAIYYVLGLPYAITLALIGGLSHLVPRLGPALSILPAAAVGFGVSPLLGTLTFIGGVAVQILTHKISSRSMENDSYKINALLQVMVLLALVDLGGLSSMIFAPPLAALLQVVYLRMFNTPTAAQQDADMLALLMERYKAIKNSADISKPQVASVLRRSDDLIRQANEALRQQARR